LRWALDGDAIFAGMLLVFFVSAEVVIIVVGFGEGIGYS
jgi:hypothetical protein